MKSTNEILKRIREVCGLEKLEFGCRFNVFTSERIIMEIEGNEVKNLAVGSNIVFSNTIENIKNSKNIEIIGLPVELSHLLMAIDFNSTNEKESVSISCNFMRVESYGKSELYNLSLTVEQNLNQNDELRAFISELIFK